MKKHDVQALYKDVQRKKSLRRRQNRQTSLFSAEKPNQGCRTCGKVTWKPYKQ